MIDRCPSCMCKINNIDIIALFTEVKAFLNEEGYEYDSISIIDGCDIPYAYSPPNKVIQITHSYNLDSETEYIVWDIIDCLEEKFGYSVQGRSWCSEIYVMPDYEAIRGW